LGRRGGEGKRGRGGKEEGREEEGMERKGLEKGGGMEGRGIPVLLFPNSKPWIQVFIYELQSTAS